MRRPDETKAIREKRHKPKRRMRLVPDKKIKGLYSCPDLRREPGTPIDLLKSAREMDRAYAELKMERFENWLDAQDDDLLFKDAIEDKVWEIFVGDKDE